VRSHSVRVMLLPYWRRACEAGFPGLRVKARIYYQLLSSYSRANLIVRRIGQGPQHRSTLISYNQLCRSRDRTSSTSDGNNSFRHCVNEDQSCLEMRVAADLYLELRPGRRGAISFISAVNHAVLADELPITEFKLEGRCPIN
jgi:hypothetical protein